jgi:methylmalonyl-CoA mutase C-terminal domain/subunit
MPPRVLIAKPGLDGHDRGAKVVAFALRDAGFEVIYTGIRRRPSEIVSIAVQEDVDVVGLSILSGAHIGLTQKVVDGLRAAGADEIKVIVGGTIPTSDVPRLIGIGAAAVCPNGTSIDALVARVRELTGFAAAETVRRWR